MSSRIRSIALAIRGIGIMLVSQKNAWIHAVATLSIAGSGLYLGLSSTEWALIVLSIMSVWTAEALNTALEFLADSVITEFHPLVGKAKDIAAGAVLITASGSAIIGILILWPHFRDEFFR